MLNQQHGIQFVIVAYLFVFSLPASKGVSAASIRQNRNLEIPESYEAITDDLSPLNLNTIDVNFLKNFLPARDLSSLNIDEDAKSLAPQEGFAEQIRSHVRGGGQRMFPFFGKPKMDSSLRDRGFIRNSQPGEIQIDPPIVVALKAGEERDLPQMNDNQIPEDHNRMGLHWQEKSIMSGPRLTIDEIPDALRSRSEDYLPDSTKRAVNLLLSKIPLKTIPLKKQSLRRRPSVKRWWGSYYRPRPQMDRRAAQSKHYGCLKRCINTGKLHPIQCHTLC